MTQKYSHSVRVLCHENYEKLREKEKFIVSVRFTLVTQENH